MAFLSGYLLLLTCLIYIFNCISRLINKRDGNDETIIMLEFNQPSHYASFFKNMLVLFLLFISQMVGMLIELYVCAQISMFVNGDEV